MMYTQYPTSTKGPSLQTISPYLLQDDQFQQGIVTFSERIDDILGGCGIPVSKLTELVGNPGSGKTQLCLQLAVAVQIPECFGGVGGHCLFIDTEQTFFLERFQQIARSAIEHCKEICDGSEEQKAALKTFNINSILNGLHYFKCTDCLHLVAVMSNLREVLKERDQVRLVVIDSIAFLMRTGFDDYSLRTQVLNGLAQQLTEVAVYKELAVVVTNHMTTRLSADRSMSQMTPALGDRWANVCSTRLLLESDEGKRTATIVKSALRLRQTVDFQILDEGIRDVLSNVPQTDNLVHDSELVGIEVTDPTISHKNKFEKLDNSESGTGEHSGEIIKHAQDSTVVKSPLLKKRRIETI